MADNNTDNKPQLDSTEDSQKDKSDGQQVPQLGPNYDEKLIALAEKLSSFNAKIIPLSDIINSIKELENLKPATSVNISTSDWFSSIVASSNKLTQDQKTRLLQANELISNVLFNLDQNSGSVAKTAQSEGVKAAAHNYQQPGTPEADREELTVFDSVEDSDDENRNQQPAESTEDIKNIATDTGKPGVAIESTSETITETPASGDIGKPAASDTPTAPTTPTPATPAPATPAPEPTTPISAEVKPATPADTDTSNVTGSTPQEQSFSLDNNNGQNNVIGPDGTYNDGRATTNIGGGGVDIRGDIDFGSPAGLDNTDAAPTIDNETTANAAPTELPSGSDLATPTAAPAVAQTPTTATESTSTELRKNAYRNEIPTPYKGPANTLLGDKSLISTIVTFGTKYINNQWGQTSINPEKTMTSQSYKFQSGTAEYINLLNLRKEDVRTGLDDLEKIASRYGAGEKFKQLRPFLAVMTEMGMNPQVDKMMRDSLGSLIGTSKANKIMDTWQELVTGTGGRGQNLYNALADSSRMGKEELIQLAEFSRIATSGRNTRSQGGGTPKNYIDALKALQKDNLFRTHDYTVNGVDDMLMAYEDMGDYEIEAAKLAYTDTQERTTLALAVEKAVNTAKSAKRAKVAPTDEELDNAINSGTATRFMLQKRQEFQQKMPADLQTAADKSAWLSGQLSAYRVSSQFREDFSNYIIDSRSELTAAEYDKAKKSVESTGMSFAIGQEVAELFNNIDTQIATIRTSSDPAQVKAARQKLDEIMKQHPQVVQAFGGVNMLHGANQASRPIQALGRLIATSSDAEQIMQPYSGNAVSAAVDLLPQLSGNALAKRNFTEATDIAKTVMYAANSGEFTAKQAVNTVGFAGEYLKKLGLDTNMSATTAAVGMNLTSNFMRTMQPGAAFDKNAMLAETVQASARAQQTLGYREAVFLANATWKNGKPASSRLQAIVSKIKSGKGLTAEDSDYLRSVDYEEDLKESFDGDSTRADLMRTQSATEAMASNMDPNLYENVLQSVTAGEISKEFSEILNDPNMQAIVQGMIGTNDSWKSALGSKDQSAADTASKFTSGLTTLTTTLGVNDAQDLLSGKRRLSTDERNKLAINNPELVKQLDDANTAYEKLSDTQQARMDMDFFVVTGGVEDTTKQDYRTVANTAASTAGVNSGNARNVLMDRIESSFSFKTGTPTDAMKNDGTVGAIITALFAKESIDNKNEYINWLNKDNMASTIATEHVLRFTNIQGADFFKELGVDVTDTDTQLQNAKDYAKVWGVDAESLEAATNLNEVEALIRKAMEDNPARLIDSKYAGGFGKYNEAIATAADVQFGTAMQDKSTLGLAAEAAAIEFGAQQAETRYPGGGNAYRQYMGTGGSIQDLKDFEKDLEKNPLIKRSVDLLGWFTSSKPRVKVPVTPDADGRVPIGVPADVSQIPDISLPELSNTELGVRSGASSSVVSSVAASGTESSEAIHVVIDRSIAPINVQLSERDRVAIAEGTTVFTS